MKHNLWRVVPEILGNMVFDLVASFILLGLGATILHFMTINNVGIGLGLGLLAVVILAIWRILTFRLLGNITPMVVDLLLSILFLGLGAILLHFMTFGNPFIVWASVLTTVIILSVWRTLTLNYSRT